MKRFFVIFFAFFLFSLFSFGVYACEDECGAGQRSCSGKTRLYCSTGGACNTWKSVSCTYGCSSGYCKCYYNGGYYPSGTKKCINGKEKSCNSGTWSTIRTCADGCGTNGEDCAVDGKCGTANGTVRYSTPTSNSSRCSRGSDRNFETKSITWEWDCKGSNGGSTANCKAYINCLRFSKNNGYQTGSCESNDRCYSVFGGNMVTKTYDCETASLGCCMYNANALICRDFDKSSDCPSCKKCILDSPGVSHCESISTEGEDGECADITKGYCSYSNVPKCNTGYGYTTSDSTGSDGYFNWTCNGQSASGCRSAGSSSGICRAAKVDPSVSLCGVAATNIYSVQSTPVVEPEDMDLCGENNSYDVDCNDCDMKGLDGTLNWTCTGDCNTAINCSAVNDVIPTFSSIVIQNESGTLVQPETADDGSQRNHICQTEFNQSKIARFVVTASDVNGVSDVGNATLRFVSVTDPNNITTTDVGTTNGTGVITFTIDTSKNFSPNTTYRIEVKIDDADNPAGSSLWINTNRGFKIWDCLVDVSGTIYDGSAGISCSGNNGYTTPIPSESIFQMAYSAGEGNSKSMVVNSPNFTSNNEDSRKLVWNSPISYRPVFVDLPGSDPLTARVNDTLCVNDSLLDPKLANPYADNPSLKVEYSIVMIQDAWFSVSDGSVFSGGKVTNFVPVTCKENCKTAINGIVWNKENSSGLSNYDLVDKKYQNKPFDAKNYTYSYFKNNYFSKLGIGITLAGPKNWSEIESLYPKDKVILVSGDLTVDKNIEKNVAGDNFRMIVAEGNINIATSVNQVNAILMAKTITATGEADQQLVINGSLYGSSSVTLDRSFTNKLDNNETPAVKVNYDPSIIFNMPKEVAKSITQWRVD